MISTMEVKENCSLYSKTSWYNEYTGKAMT